MVEVREGLKEVVVAETKISTIDGKKGILIYRGYDIHDLAKNSTFEETTFLLLKGRLPKSKEELDEFSGVCCGHRSVPKEIINLMNCSNY